MTTELDLHQATRKNALLLQQFLKEGLPPLTRADIRENMSRLWAEVRHWARKSSSFASFCALALFVGVYLYVWVKTFLSPDSHDLRLLLGGRGIMLHVAQDVENWRDPRSLGLNEQGESDN